MCMFLLSCWHPLPAGMKLFGVGFFASLLGVGMTNTLMGVRQMLDPSFVPLNPPQVGPQRWVMFATHAVTASGRRVLGRCLWLPGLCSDKPVCPAGLSTV